MRRHGLRILDLPSNGVSVALAILSVLFFIGSVAGCVFAERVEGSGEETLTGYLEGYLSVAASGEITKPDFWILFWKSARWPLAVASLGLTPLGLLGIPISFLIRGFLLSFSIASFFRVLGAQGLAVGFVLFGLSGLICVPILFLLGVQGFLNAGTIANRLVGEARQKTSVGRKTLLSCGVCAAILCAGCLIEYYAVPVLLKSFSDMLLN